ncbi:ChrR family anti-sigma-E factor (plasmid) [Skermanella rosea]|uniref:ChrR family anti-sigma-E factor n=1 Tax=Skermanella rosea TaxID=1817965 RepID=UPI001932E627|nr:ChrR family anti-sigma-E factor [Skermanella rosea]UEM07702.1 ChrR family anti-sigma-E factor [Skermanella rosea]
MSTLTHHPPEDLLVCYAAGSLGEAQALAVATHLAYCPACRRENERLDEIGGLLLWDLPPEPLPEDALASLLARLDGEGAEEPAARPASAAGARDCGVLGDMRVPEPLRTYLRERAGGAGWTVLAEGVQSLRLDVGRPPEVAEILRMAPGSALPAHRHSDQELILVLQGSFSEAAGPFGDAGGRYAGGDLGEFEGGSIHTVVAGEDGCVCYRVLAGPVERLVEPP